MTGDADHAVRGNDTIQQVSANLIDQEDCRFKMSGQGPNVTDNMLCARVASSYCSLSGDPLVCERASRAERYLWGGITSWGVDCSQSSGLPDVFTHVSNYYHGWIMDHIRQYSGNDPINCIKGLHVCMSNLY